MSFKRAGLSQQIGLFDIINVAVMVFICFSMLYPIWYIIINSLNGTDDALRGAVNFWGYTL